MSDQSEQDPRVFFAAERTFLSWIRTGLALMGFGFVVARFAMLLRELTAPRQSDTLIGFLELDGSVQRGQ